ncbi:DUF4124 domain-containing protein [Pseudoxanthomonas winnipegensis]|uniref:DUF4124 domain-containing protein n=1 Tax=Pseudoxanthomonas winnipegensis TaxID=2480810 RepID=UPI0030F4157B
MPAPLLLLPLAFALTALAWSASAQAQAIHRCTDASGVSVFTDRRCEDLGAASRVPRPLPTIAGEAGDAPARTHLGCPRKLSDLVQRIGAAIAAKDANDLAALYQWNGISDASANRLLDRMEGIVRRPLLDITPVLPAPDPVVEADGTITDANTDGFYPQATPPQRRRPVGLRLQQTLSNGTPTSTVIGIRRSYDCFWISL